MSLLSHPLATGVELHKPFRYEGATDPGAVGAGWYWVDQSVTPYLLKRRNDSNSGWTLIGSGGLTDPTTTQGDLIIRGASALQRLAIGANGSVPLSNGTTLSYTTSPTLAGEVTAPDIKVTGVTGAGSQCRLVGATASGAPTTGTFAAGDVVVDLTGKFWICTGAGTPGVWAQASSGMANPMTSNQDMIVGGSSGLPTRLSVGANGQVLGISGGVIGWVNNPSGFVNPMTQPGDMIYGSTAGSPTRLANGSNGQVLTMIAGLPGWANPTGGVGSSNNVSSNLYLGRTCL